MSLPPPPTPDALLVRHLLLSTSVTPTCNAPSPSSPSTHPLHKHAPGCGHAVVQHESHLDYLVSGQLQHEHDDHVDIHGEVQELREGERLIATPVPMSPVASRRSPVSHPMRRRNTSTAPRLPAASSQSHSQSHSIAWHKDKDAIRFLSMLCLTSLFMIVELSIGYLIGSLSLRADGIHMLSDALALIIGFYSLRATKRRSSLTATYGFARFEVVGALVNSVFLIAAAIEISIEALQRFSEPVDVLSELGREVDLMLIVGGSGLAINIVGLVIFASAGQSSHSHSHAHGHGETAPVAPEAHGHSHGGGMNMNIRGVLLHVAGDALGSIAVIVSACVMKYTTHPFRFYCDPVVSLVIVLLILLGTVPLLRQSANILLQKVPLSVDVSQLRQQLLSVPGVLAVHDFHVWSLDSSRVIATLHVTLDRRISDFRRVQDDLKMLLHSAGIHASTIQPEFMSATMQQMLESNQAARITEDVRADEMSSATTVAEIAAGAIALPTDIEARGGIDDFALPLSKVGEHAAILGLDLCNELVCGDACTKSSCCPEPVRHEEAKAKAKAKDTRSTHSPRLLSHC